MNQAENRATSPTLKYAFFLLGITVLVYAQTVRFPFLKLDDKPFIIESASIRHWSSLPSYFVPNIAADPYLTPGQKIPNFYRPAVGLWLLVSYKLFGLHAVLWRMMVLVLYGLGVWLLWRLAYKLTQDDFTAFAAALLFALHPLHVEGVAWISGACVELLLCIFFFGGFLAYLRWRESARPLWLAVCGILVLLALFSKETGAALPLLIVAHALIFRLKDCEARNLRRLPLAVALALPVAVYAALRFFAIHGVVHSAGRHSWSEVLLSVPLFFAVYLQHTVWPVHLGNWYSIQIHSEISFREFFLPLLLCVAYAAVTVWAIIRKPVTGFCLLWWAVPLIPAFIGMIDFVDNEYMHDRFTFVALGGLCILAASLLRSVPTTGRSLFGFRAGSVAGLAAVTAALGMLSASLIYTWRSDFSMELNAMEASPTAVRPRILLGNELQERKDWAAALALYLDTVKIDPNRWESLFAYGTALANDGYRADAVRVLMRGVQVAPSKSPFYLVLADIFARAGQFDDASKVLQSGLSVAEHPELLRAKLAEVQALENHVASR